MDKNKKKLILVLLSAVFLVPLVIAFIAHAFGFVNPGLFGGISLLLGTGYFIYWANSRTAADDHKEQPGTKP